jgi:hypothetical protein
MNPWLQVSSTVSILTNKHRGMWQRYSRDLLNFLLKRNLEEGKGVNIPMSWGPRILSQTENSRWVCPDHHLQDYLQDDEQSLDWKHPATFQMRGHFQDIKKLMEKEVHSDSYTRHLISIWSRGAAAPTPGMWHDLINCEIIWQGNPISVIKTFGKWRSTYAWCNRERMEIINRSPIDWSTLVPKFMEHIVTNQGSIGLTNRMPPVLMKARSMKRLSWRHQTHSNAESMARHHP